MGPTNANSRADFEDLFPAKLHYVLEQVEKDGGRDVIAWRSHGKAFLVKNREKFVKDLLPNWFRQKKWASFQRQLNHYGFKRMTADRNAYYHPSFVKSDRGLCRHIRRSRNKGNGHRKPGRPEDEPNFYLDRDPVGSVASNDAAHPATAHPIKVRPSTLIRSASSENESHPTPFVARSMPMPSVSTSSYDTGCARSLKPPSLASMLRGSWAWSQEDGGGCRGGAPVAGAAHPPGPPQYYEIFRPVFVGSSGAGTSVPARAAGWGRDLRGRHGGRCRAPPRPSDAEAAGAPQDDCR